MPPLKVGWYVRTSNVVVNVASSVTWKSNYSFSNYDASFWRAHKYSSIITMNFKAIVYTFKLICLPQSGQTSCA